MKDQQVLGQRDRKRRVRREATSNPQPVIRIGVRKNRKKDDGYPNLVVNGTVDIQSYVFGNKGERIYARVHSRSVAKSLMRARLQEIEERFEHIDLPYDVDWNPYFDSVSVDFRVYRDKKFPSIDIELQPDGEKWAKPYSMAEYAEVLERMIKARNTPDLEFFQSDELISNGFGLRCRIKSTEVIVKDEIERCVQELKRICDEAETFLVTSARRNSVTTFFTFPAEIRAACEQYLLYFVQFLDDLGIKAAAEIKEDAQRVLFSVTPEDGATALKQVREALDVYLQLPRTPALVVLEHASGDIAVQQLQANILHLRSQLILANAVLGAKDAAIEALQVSNFQYRQLLSSDETAKSDQEGLIGDIVHVTKVEAKGIRLDLPLILRRLKRRFGFDTTSQDSQPALPNRKI